MEAGSRICEGGDGSEEEVGGRGLLMSRRVEMDM